MEEEKKEISLVDSNKDNKDLKELNTLNNQQYFAFVSAWVPQQTPRGVQVVPNNMLFRSIDRTELIRALLERNICPTFIEELIQEQYDSLNSKIVRPS